MPDFQSNSQGSQRPTLSDLAYELWQSYFYKIGWQTRFHFVKVGTSERSKKDAVMLIG
jgi:hypothetical protein